MPSSRAVHTSGCTWRYEELARTSGYQRVAGCDEAGRGSLLGPLYAAAVILDPARPIAGVDDSKKLSPAARAGLAKAIEATSLAYCVIAVSAREVDRLNVYEASRLAMIQAIEGLNLPPDFILTDAMPLQPRLGNRGLHLPHTSIIRGDTQSVSIAAASILAKVHRDRHMMELDALYPQYNLASNKGYGTPLHLQAILRHGPCAEHRRTYQPVKDMELPFLTGISETGEA